MTQKTLNYSDAGVDITAGNDFIEAIKPLVKATHTPQVLSGLGGFAAFYALDNLANYTAPTLVSCTDGVGTKLKLALELNQHDTIGQDLVAMCVNDLIVCGAKPLFFLDYYATGKLNPTVAQSVLASIAKACQLAQTALVGGETAEMPGMYQQNDYDLAGFCVGMVDKPKIIDGSTIEPGDICLGLASSGLHSNGYSLARKLLDTTGAKLSQTLGDITLGDALLAPTEIYVSAILNLLKELPIAGMAHITGGGLLENIPRCLPENCTANLYESTWQRPAIYDWIAQTQAIAPEEMHRTFNCGIGMVVIVKANVATQAQTHLAEQGHTVYRIGEITTRKDHEAQVIFHA